MRKYFSEEPETIKFNSDRWITQAMCEGAVLDGPETMDFVPDRYITQELRKRAAEEKPYALHFHM